MGRRWLLVVLALVVLGAAAVAWFEPHKLFLDDRVDQALPSAAAAVTSAAPADVTDEPEPAVVAPVVPAGPVDLAGGTFISREHETIGTVRVVELPDGQRIVRLEGFTTSNGPDLYVYLSQNPATGPDDAFDDGALDLGPLQGNIGDQNYVLPPGTDPADHVSVVIWCDRFSASFGAADLVLATT